MRTSMIVIGVGTPMRGDDGFGPAVVDALHGRPGLGGRVLLAYCDGEPARMLELWDGFDHAVVIDAVRGGGERHGYLYHHELTAAAMREPKFGEPGGNGHAVGFSSAIRLAEAMGRMPRRLTLYAVHGKDFSLGAPLSRPVAAVVPKLAARISEHVRSVHRTGLLRDESPGPYAPVGPGVPMLLGGNLGL